MKESSGNPSSLIDCLKSLGMTKYEALVYIALMKVMSATASEIHESSGVPRASVYPVLDQLLDKDLVSVSQSSPKRFAAIPPELAIARLTDRIEHDARIALDALLTIHHKKNTADEGNGELIWNIYGIAGIRKRLSDLVTHAETGIRIIAHNGVLSPDIRAALVKQSERVSVEIITPYWANPVPESMKLYLRKYPDMPQNLDAAKEMISGGVCIIDSRRVLVIVGSGEEDAVALFSESEAFIRFFIRYYDLNVEWLKRQENAISH